MRTNVILKKTYFDLGILILRIYLGVVLIWMSSGYLFDSTSMEGLQSFLESMDWPAPKLFAYSSQLIELIGGAMLILGFRFGAWVLVGVLMSAVIFAHGFRIFEDAALPMHFAIMAWVIALAGCGKYSLDTLFFQTKNQ
ncbi:hypothetical protein GCM10009119_01790 [Algoriphagus jejuensis]|uniref:DoxX family protein n=1 Tax=Algoriphagus jejuensis TaxID=419934 RepID=A0ABP3Y6X6_9BACT